MDAQPTDWPQRVRRGLSFVPSAAGHRFEAYINGDRREWQIDTRTAEVYTRAGTGWDAPAWLELPPAIRRRVHEILAAPGPAG